MFSILNTIFFAKQRRSSVTCERTPSEYFKYFTIFLVFIAFFIAEYLTPFHSDDYSYGQMGLDFTRHYNHYMGWSGRLVADYASSLILLCHKHHAIVSVIIALFALGTLYLTAALPNKLLGTKFSSFKFLIIVALYWICNPNLGQITFWVVGACNYLVTNFFIVLFLYAFLSWRDSLNIVKTICLFILAVVAGCTNENTSVTIVYTFVALCLLMKWLEIKFDIKGACICLVGLIIGTLALLLAPGNYARLNTFGDFKSLPLKEKIFNHLNNNFNFLKYFWQSYVLYLLGTITLLRKIRESNNLQRLLFAFLFLSSAFVAWAVMFASPYMPPRSYSGPFFFLLIAVSFALDIKFFNALDSKFIGLLGIYVIGACVYTWTFVFISYGITKDQEVIRIEQINYEKLLKGSTAKPVIPDWYVVHLRRKHDMFDWFHSGAMAGWYGVAEVDLIRDFDYDYSVMNTGHEITLINNSDLANTKAFIREANWKYHRNGTLVIETTSDIRNKRIIASYYDLRSRDRKDIVLSSKVLCFKGKYYTGATIRKLSGHVSVAIRVE